MSEISSHALSIEIENNLVARLQEFSQKWDKSLRKETLRSMIAILKTSATCQIALEVNAALTAYQDGHSLHSYHDQFKKFQNPEFLNNLTLRGSVIEKGLFKGEALTDALQLLKDFSVFVGKRASAYFEEVAPRSQSPEVIPLVKKEKAAPVILSQENKPKSQAELEEHYRPALIRLRQFQQSNLDNIYCVIKGTKSPHILEEHCKKRILPLYMAASWDIRQKKLRGEEVSEQDLKRKQDLENAYGVCKDKIDQLNGLRKVQTLASVTPIATKPPVRPIITSEKKIAETGLKKAGQLITARAIAASVIACSTMAALALSASGFFGSAAAERMDSQPTAKTSDHAVHFNHVTKNVAAPKILVVQNKEPVAEQIPPTIKPLQKISQKIKANFVKGSFVKSSNDNHFVKPAPAIVNGFQMQRTTQDTITNMCRVYTHPTFLCSNG